MKNSFNNLYIGARKATEETAVDLDRIHKQPENLDGIDLFLYTYGAVDGIRNFSMLDLLESGKTERELWEIAKRNTLKQSFIRPLWQFLDIPEDSIPLYIMAAGDLPYEAGCIACADSISGFLKSVCGCTKAMIFPSSVHEILIYPVSDEEADAIDIEAFSEMVAEINAHDVRPDEVLSDRAYYRTF